jgi:hypothetical protein
MNIGQAGVLGFRTPAVCASRILNVFDPTQAADFDNDGHDDLPITAAPSLPTPFYDERPSKVFIVRGGANGLTSEPALVLSGAPGYGVAFTAGDYGAPATRTGFCGWPPAYSIVTATFFDGNIVRSARFSLSQVTARARRSATDAAAIHEPVLA